MLASGSIRLQLGGTADASTSTNTTTATEAIETHASQRSGLNDWPQTRRATAVITEAHTREERICGHGGNEGRAEIQDLAFASEEGIEELMEYNTFYVEEEDETVEITEEGITEVMKERRMCKDIQKQMNVRSLLLAIIMGSWILCPLPPN
jgi:hypothetical protein